MCVIHQPQLQSSATVHIHEDEGLKQPRGMSQKNSLRKGALIGLTLWAWFVTIGCTRSHYRARADRESYCLVESRQLDPLWDLPPRQVEPASFSRMHIQADLDCAPKPIDDRAAKQFMDCPDGFDNTRYYSKIPTQGHTENPIWVDHLPRDPKSKQIKLTQPLAVDLALLHSRDYQTQFEQVYLAALALSGNRFEFDTQWAGGGGTNFTATGTDLGDQRLLQVSDRLGFSRNLAGGGQFATNILNSLFWDFGSGNLQGGSAALVTSFSQPLLRGAFRYVRLENLTQSERNLLYQVRDFARFRRLFHLDVTSNYLGLLTQLQAIRNAETNVENLRRNLREYELLVGLGMASQIQADQVFQQYQNARLSLLSSQQNLIASLDEFKFQLGLPAWVPFEIDETLLEPFELVDPQIEALKRETDDLYLSLAQYIPPESPPKELLKQAYDSYVKLRGASAEFVPALEQELARWIERLDATDVKTLDQDDRLDIEQQIVLAERIKTRLAEQQQTLDGRKDYDGRLEQLIATNAPDSRALEGIQNAVGVVLRAELDELYIAQSQIRMFLIDIEPLKIQEQQAITFAHRQRLDLMNSQATVMDAYRKVEVAANALKSDLSVTGSVALGSDPGKNNAFRFDSSANSYRVGAQFDGPLNRRNERNFYRAQQINYQRASRAFIADKDQVANEVRSVLRQLTLRRLNFQIARQQLVAATRQVDQAQMDLRTSNEAEANLTLFLLQALQGMVDAKNNLISNWINYRIQRMRLFVALEMLYLDENGQWINDENGLQELENFDLIDAEYFPAQWMTEIDLPDADMPEADTLDAEKVEGEGTKEDLPQPTSNQPTSNAATNQTEQSPVRPADGINLPPGNN